MEWEKKHQDQPGIPTRKVPMESIIDYSMINSKIPLKKYWRGANPTFSKPWTPPSLAVSMNKPAGIPKIVNSHILKAVPAEYSPFFFFLGAWKCWNSHSYITSCRAVALCPVTSLHMMMCSNKITWNEDRMGLQSSTGKGTAGIPSGI